ncbi:MAG: deoxyribodipyrimidine photo-lyase, partial [Bacteroidota bacterium]
MSKRIEAMETINIVWLKRDIRTQDHAAFQAAEKDGSPYLIIYIFEPSILAHHDSALRHQQFIFHSLKSVDEKLTDYNRNVEVFHEEVSTVFEHLTQKFNIQSVFSHQETGIEVTWKRDKKLSQFFKSEGIIWKEFQRDGIIRGITNRNGWDKQWFVNIAQPTIQNTYSQSILDPLDHPFHLTEDFKNKLEDYPEVYQPAGESNAWKYLNSFAEERGFNYSKHISKPAESRFSGGRISPYLAWGNLSIKQAYQHVKHHENFGSNKR